MLVDAESKLHGLAAAIQGGEMTIIQRLRKHALPDPHDEREVMHAPLLREAADCIESLSAQVAELKKDNAALLAENVRHNNLLGRCIARREAAEAQVAELKKVLRDASNYIKHGGANHVMRGQPHPQQWLVDDMERLLDAAKEGK